MRTIGKLTLVGAGPGDPDLITIKGVKALKCADVVLYDALVHPDLLLYAPKALHVPVGKRAGKSSVKQETIHHLIVEYGMKGANVVRLKGGDPFVFARGLEELEYASKFGMSTEVVLGISSLHLPGYYGIPLTCRGVNQSFSVVTATTSEGTLSDEIKNAAKYAPMTIVFMGLGKIDEIARLYQEEGRGQLPVAVISRGSFEDGVVLSATVDTISETIFAENPPAPALLVFGEGARYAASNASSMINSNLEVA